MNVNELKQILTEHVPDFRDKEMLRREMEKDQVERLREYTDSLEPIHEFALRHGSDVAVAAVRQLISITENVSVEFFRKLIFRYVYNDLGRDMPDVQKFCHDMDNNQVWELFDEVVHMKLEPLTEKD